MLEKGVLQTWSALIAWKWLGKMPENVGVKSYIDAKYMILGVYRWSIDDDWPRSLLHGHFYWLFIVEKVAFF